MQINLKALAFNIIFFGVFLIISGFWAGYSELSINLFKSEFILFIAFAVLFVPTAVKSDKKYYLGTLAFISLYLILDFVFILLHRLPAFSDIKEIMPLLNFMPIYIMAGLAFASVYILFCAWLFVYNDSVKTTLYKLAGLVPVSIILFFTINSGYSKKATPKEFGRISSILINEKFSKDLFLELKNYADPALSLNKQYQNHKIKNKKNIHVLVLESYTDPRLYNIDKTLKDKITKLVPKIDFDLYKSPTFGGGTSKTEFEVLSGHPSFPLLNTVDFNVMNGKRVNSFLNFLKDNGYEIQSTVATKNTFFNSVKAYKSLGFDKVDYLRDREPFLNDQVMFEADVLNETKSKLSSTNSPVFSYTLGMYGHTPHFRDLNLRPNLIEHSDFTFEKIINQFIYRTRAIDTYLNNLLKSDPNSIIFIIGDHLPPQVFRGVNYSKGIYQNIGLLLVDGKKVNISNQPTYKIHWKIIEELTGQSYKIPSDKNSYLDSYFNFIYQSN